MNINTKENKNFIIFQYIDNGLVFNSDFIGNFKFIYSNCLTIKNANVSVKNIVFFGGGDFFG